MSARRAHGFPRSRPEKAQEEFFRGLLCLPCNATRLPAYERLPHVLRDSPRFNTYLNSPPARHPEARPTVRDHTSPRDFHSLALDAFFTTTDHPERNALSP
ncbi:hypothetical protein [Streptomyces sp. NPDC088847]|uniref:hypothetical protein n=1 Tax=Streptomyces sp. NPDC088847 TaxID=3365909 RepID=UPI003805133A